jgi:hypothetical protein
MKKNQILPSLWKFTLPYNSRTNFPQNDVQYLLLYSGLTSMLNIIYGKPNIVDGAQNKAALQTF